MYEMQNYSALILPDVSHTISHLALRDVFLAMYGMLPWQEQANL